MVSPKDRHVAHQPLEIPVEIEIFLNPDGSVTFADLEESAVAIARALDPNCDLACDVTSPPTSLPSDHARP
jgi:hypothetical protein